MLGDEFIDIPSFGWVETNPSDDNYDYYRKTITTVFFCGGATRRPVLVSQLSDDDFARVANLALTAPVRLNCWGKRGKGVPNGGV